ncbi:type II secretion system protein N [Chitinimonas sp.]|uniref:type II secretion system protein N n=1 Tax=Chitinimonas sp. TaxID=1934313 RepID=UPI002F91D1C4
MIVSLPNSPWFYRCLNAVLLLVVAWLSAGLIWQVFAPRAKPPVAAPAQAAVRSVTQDMSPLNALFGPPSGGDLQASSLSLKLRGVIASETPAAAVFERAGQPSLAVRTGEEIEAGVVLLEVAADHVVVDNHGRRERLELDAKAAAQGVLPAADAPPPAPSPMIVPAGPVSLPPPVAPSGRMSMAPPGGRGGDERSLSRQALVAGMQGLNVADWARGLSDAPAGGIMVESAASQPLAGPLGLQSGDILKSVNGAALARKGDISALYGAFSSASAIQIEILRNGTPMSLRYRIESHAKP